MIKDIEEESKTKFSMEVEFSFSFKDVQERFMFILQRSDSCGRIIVVYPQEV